MLVASDLEDAVRRVCDEGPAELVLDLRDLTFMDSTGLRSTLAAHELCKQSGSSLTVVPGPRQVQTLFELTGLTAHLPFQTDGAHSSLQQGGLLPRLFSPAESPAAHRV